MLFTSLNGDDLRLFRRDDLRLFRRDDLRRLFLLVVWKVGIFVFSIVE